MCPSPDCSVVQLTIELKYANRRRASALRWLLANGALLAVLIYDLCGWCAWGGAAWAEALAAGVLAAGVALHGTRALAPRRAAAPTPLSPAQLRLLGLRPEELDASLVARAAGAAGATPTPAPARAEEPGSLSPRRSWRAAAAPPAPPSPPPSPPQPDLRASPDEFISDGQALAAYIRQQSERWEAGVGVGVGVGAWAGVGAGAGRAHQLATLPEKDGCGGEEEGGGGAGAGGAGGRGGDAAPWRRLQLDPQRLAEYCLNLRLWLHVTVVGRVARALAAAAGGPLPPPLLPFLEPFADRQYVTDRIKELGVGGCLSAYRWSGGGRGWHGARPADAELVLHLLAAYLDALAPAADFRARHVSLAPAPPVHCGVHRVCASPPHYALRLAGETLDVPRGRSNLLLCLLLLLAAAAQRQPPALCRLHLGPAGLNMLWILGR